MTDQEKLEVHVELILNELNSAEIQHPKWPDDLLHQIAIMNEEAGEATRAALHVVYEDGKKSELANELRQTAAMCIRILKNLTHD